MRVCCAENQLYPIPFHNKKLFDPSYDFVNVFDGPTSDSQLLASLTGRRTYEKSPSEFLNDDVVPLYAPDVIVSSGNQILVNFSSDENINAAGFSAVFQILDPELVCMADSDCVNGNCDSGVCICPFGYTGIICQTRKSIFKLVYASLV